MFEDFFYKLINLKKINLKFCYLVMFEDGFLFFCKLINLNKN